MMELKERYKGQILLLLTVLVAPVAIYRLALVDTVQLWMQRNTGREKKELLLMQTQAQNASTQSGDKDTSYNTSLSSFLFTVSEKNNCVMESYTPYQGDSNPDKERSSVTISTAEAVITGKFLPLVTVIYALEEFSLRWKIVSTDFKASKPHPKTGEIQIKLSIIIQYI